MLTKHNKEDTPEYKKEEALYPILMKQAAKLERSGLGIIKVRKQFRQYMYDRRFFLSIDCEPHSTNQVDKAVRELFPEARRTSHRLNADTSYRVVYSTMM